MKYRVLALRTNAYPNAATATRRFESFCHYLYENGFDVTVLALTPTDACMAGKRHLNPACRFEVIRVPEPPSRHPFIGLVERQMARRFFPAMHDSAAANRAVSRAAFRLLSERHFDCMLTTYPPMGSLLLADRLSQKFNLPWIADLRDIPDEFDSSRREWITRRTARMLGKACASAAHILTVSEPLGRRLKSHYALQAPISIVYNGFEDDLFAQQELPATDKFFRITYCGNFGSGRDPLMLFDALDMLASQGESMQGVEVHFYGTRNKDILRATRRWKGMLQCHGVVPHAEALAAQMQSAILLSLSSPSCQGILTSKIFEYAMIGRPVLSIPPDDDVLDDFIQKARIGHVGRSVEDVAAFIKNHLAFWRATGMLPRSCPDKTYIGQFSRSSQAGKVNDAIRQVLRRSC
ncbi:MAG: glycosyltransferase [Deltaproteobacteria bacterium]|nr:glycosyltransferase [Deltaproteobacteria bacterium]